MKKLKTNVVKKQWHFEVTYSDGRTEQVTVEAESYNAAIFGLPVFGPKGKYKLLERPPVVQE